MSVEAWEWGCPRRSRGGLAPGLASAPHPPLHAHEGPQRPAAGKRGSGDTMSWHRAGTASLQVCGTGAPAAYRPPPARAPTFVVVTQADRDTTAFMTVKCEVLKLMVRDADT